jgi:hypothetical protein
MPWAILAFFLCWHSLAKKKQKIISASALSGLPLKIFVCGQWRPQQVVTATWPMDAMGYSGLFFVLAFLGQERIGSASALASFPLKFFGCGQWHPQQVVAVAQPTDAMG